MYEKDGSYAGLLQLCKELKAENEQLKSENLQLRKRLGMTNEVTVEQRTMTQWKKSLETFIQLDVTPPEEKKGRGRKNVWSPVGVLGAGKDTLHGLVDVAVMQSLVNGDEVKELVRNYGMIIITRILTYPIIAF